MATRAVLLVGLLVVAAVVAITLAPSEPRRSGTNNVPVTGAVDRLAPEAEVCQSEDVPPATAAVRLRVEPRVAPPRPVVRVEPAGGGPTVVGRRTTAVAGDAVDVSLRREPPAGAAEVCVRNAGARPLVLLGFPTGDRGDRPAGPVAFDYYRAGSESWWQLASVVAERVAYGKSELLGGWTLWLAVALVLAAWALAATALWRIGAPE